MHRVRRRKASNSTKREVILPQSSQVNHLYKIYKTDKEGRGYRFKQETENTSRLHISIRLLLLVDLELQNLQKQEKTTTCTNIWQAKNHSLPINHWTQNRNHQNYVQISPSGEGSTPTTRRGRGKSHPDLDRVRTGAQLAQNEASCLREPHWKWEKTWVKGKSSLTIKTRVATSCFCLYIEKLNILNLNVFKENRVIFHMN